MTLNAAQLAGLLPPHSVLAACEGEELDDLLANATLHRVSEDDVLLEQGEDGDTLIILLQGTVRVSMVTSNGREIILDYAEPGAVLGELAVLDGEPRNASAVAMEKGSLLKMTRRAFEAFILRHPKMALRMMREMARRLRETDATIESDRAFTTAPRLARYLRRLTEHKTRGHTLTSQLSQSELGNFVGISRENINRQLAVWAAAGIIELEQGRIRIIDGDYLSQIADAGD